MRIRLAVPQDAEALALLHIAHRGGRRTGASYRMRCSAVSIPHVVRLGFASRLPIGRRKRTLSRRPDHWLGSLRLVAAATRTAIQRRREKSGASTWIQRTGGRASGLSCAALPNGFSASEAAGTPSCGCFRITMQGDGSTKRADTPLTAGQRYCKWESRLRRYDTGRHSPEGACRGRLVARARERLAACWIDTWRRTV